MFTFNFGKKELRKIETVLGIVLKETAGKLLVFQVNSQAVVLKETKEFQYSNGLENLVEDIDQKLENLENQGYKDFSQSIYFLSSLFLEEKTKEVRKSFLVKLKEISDKLSLKTVGYVDIDSVILNQIEKENSLPLSAIFLDIDKTYFQFILKKAGRNIFEKRFSRSDNFLFDFYEAISCVKEYIPLPIRIIMFDDDSLQEVKNTLISHHFKEEYFIQPPKVEILSTTKVNQYLAEIIKKGFILDQDREIDQKKTTQSFGFVIGKDIREESQTAFKEEKKEDSFVNKKTFINWSLIKNRFSTVFSLARSFLNLSFLSSTINRLNIFILGLMIIGLAIFVNEYYFHRLKLFITPEKKKFQKVVNLSEDQVGVSAKKTYRLITKSIPTSGSKLIGEKAKGEIFLFNYTFSQKLLKAGMVLSANSLKFILNDDVKIASASYIGNQVGNPLEPSKVKVTITATAIGEESNLPKGTVFQIEGLSTNEVFGKNEVSLSGGTKKTIKVYSKEDQDKLKATVLAETKKTFFQSRPLQDKNLILISDLTKFNFIEEDYSHELEDEAEKVSLKAKVEIDYYFYNQVNLRERIYNLIKKETPQGYQLNKEKINLALKKISQKDDHRNFEFFINGFYNKDIDYQELKKRLVFLKRKDMPVLLKSYHINKFVVKEENKIFLFNNFSPFFIKNIEVIEN